MIIQISYKKFIPWLELMLFDVPIRAVAFTFFWLLTVRKNFVAGHTVHSRIHSLFRTHKHFPCNLNRIHLWLWVARNERLEGKELTWKSNHICLIPDLDSEDLGSGGGGEAAEMYWDVLLTFFILSYLSLKIADWDAIIDFTTQPVDTIRNY